MPLISTRAGASARGFSHMASSILPGFNNNSTLALAHSGSPYGTVYKFNDVTGYGTKYADPATSLPSNARAVKFINNTSNPAQSIVFGTSTITNSLVGYRFSTTTGFGTRYTSNAAGTYIYSLAAGVSGSVVAAGLLDSPYLIALPWDVGFGTKYANPATLLTDIPYGLDFNPAGTVLLAQNSQYPYVHAYQWSSGFGTKYADLTSGISYALGHIKFHPNGDSFVVGYGSNVYAWSSGFGTKYADPTGKPIIGKGAAWNPAGTVIAFSDTYSGKLVAYDWSSGFGTKYTDSATLPSSSFTSAFAWNPTGTAMSVGVSGSPYVFTYSWYNGFQKRYTSPITTPTGVVDDIAFL